MVCSACLPAVKPCSHSDPHFDLFFSSLKGDVYFSLDGAFPLCREKEKRKRKQSLLVL